MTTIDISLDKYVEQEKQGNQKKREQESPLEQMPAPKQQKKSAEPEFILQPVSFNHMLNIEGRETDLPDAPKEKMECPAVPDMKKAEEDYNSIDYQMIAFNLWKSKARELF
ncbi:hypothetical protein HZA99_05025 [Candidatus Woesearchaeota archaeon]|nr:hypothetical protein [Candidatus Woesearchaeota archaeon]